MDLDRLAKGARRKTKATWWRLTRGVAYAFGVDAETQVKKAVFETIAWHIEAHLMTGDDTELCVLQRLCSNPACATFKYRVGKEVCWYCPKDPSLRGVRGTVRGVLPVNAQPHYYVEFSGGWSQLVREAELRGARWSTRASPDEDASPEEDESPEPPELCERHTSHNLHVTALAGYSGGSGQDDAPEVECREGTGGAPWESTATEAEAAFRGCVSTRVTAGSAATESEALFSGCVSTKTSVSSAGAHGDAASEGCLSAQASECSGSTNGDAASGGQRGVHGYDVRGDRQQTRRMRRNGDTYWEMRVKSIRPDHVGMDLDTYEVLYGDLRREPASAAYQARGLASEDMPHMCHVRTL